MDESGGSTKSNAPQPPLSVPQSKASAKVAPLNVVENEVHSQSRLERFEEEIQTIEKEVGEEIETIEKEVVGAEAFVMGKLHYHRSPYMRQTQKWVQDGRGSKPTNLEKYNKFESTQLHNTRHGETGGTADAHDERPVDAPASVPVVPLRRHWRQRFPADNGDFDAL